MNWDDFMEQFGNHEGVIEQLNNTSPITIPTVRRVFPQLLARELVGVQPMTGALDGLRFTFSTNIPAYKAIPVPSLDEIRKRDHFSDCGEMFEI